MTTPTARQPPTGTLASYLVGDPVARAHGLAFDDALTFLLAHAGAQPVIDAYLRVYNTLGSPVTVPVQYCRSPGARAVLIEMRLYGEGTGGNSCHGTVSVAASSGATLSWISQAGLDGTTRLDAIDTTHPSSPEGPTIRAILDVSGLTVGTTDDLLFTFTKTTAAFGIMHLHVSEIPIPSVDPVGSPTDEVGVDQAWYAPNSLIVDGASNQPRGFKRMVGQLLSAKTDTRRHLQITTHDDNAATWQTSSGSFANPFGVTFVHRARRVYSAATPNRYTFRVLYRTSAGAAGEAKMGDGVNTVTISLPTSTTRAVATGIFQADTGGVGQEQPLAYQHRRSAGSGGDLVHTIGWSLIEAEL